MDINDEEFQKLMEENKHIFALRDKISAACNNHSINDIETAFLMIMSKMYCDSFETDRAMDLAAQFTARLIMIIKAFEDNFLKPPGEYLQ